MMETLSSRLINDKSLLLRADVKAFIKELEEEILSRALEDKEESLIEVLHKLAGEELL